MSLKWFCIFLNTENALAFNPIRDGRRVKKIPCQFFSSNFYKRKN